MKPSVSALALGAFLAGFAVLPAQAQQLPETIVQLNVVAVAEGYRASKIIGEDVENNAGEKIGKVNDLLITRNDRVAYAILSVGGFLGIGGKLVAVSYSQLRFEEHAETRTTTGGPAGTVAVPPVGTLAAPVAPGVPAATPPARPVATTRLVLPGATRDSLRAQPEFRYGD